MSGLPERILAVVFACVLALPAGAARGGFGAGPGVEHIDTSVDVTTLLDMAEQGDARAAFLLGTRYASGRSGARDDSEAVRWFRRAADRQLAEAQYNLGIMYALGRGVERDPVEAARWYRLAADQGLAEAQYNLGTLYGTGTGVPRDEALAAEWLRKAANLALPEAQYNLGVLYEHGRGVRVDGRAAMVWYKRAADGGYAQAGERLRSLMARLNVSEVPEFVYDLGGTGNSGTESIPSSVRDRPSTAPAVDRAGARVAAMPVAAGSRARSQPVGRGRAWVASLDPDHYTLQVLSDTNEDSVGRFVRRHFKAGEAGYFATRRNGRTWYSAVWGDFGDYDIAKGAIRHLPPDLRSAKPWVRKVRLIQESMLPPGSGQQ